MMTTRMMTTRAVMTSMVLSAAIFLTGGAIHAQDAQTCQPGFETAHNGPRQPQYDALINALTPHTEALSADLAALTDQATYETLLAEGRATASAIPAGRVVITVPDGTVVLDTSRADNTEDPKSNSYQHFLDKTINENHNTRLAFSLAQHYPCGVALESKLSTTDGTKEDYFAVRLGNHLDSFGTARISARQ
jgi:ABC-type molybdate transport system substrate-binding protein